MGYYALPDPVYHPNYSAVGAWALSAGFTWAWTLPAGVTDVTPGGQPANYVELQYGATGNYAITVAETAPAAFGSCADATPTLMNVTVVAPPVATIVTADPAQACGDQVAMAVAMTFTEAVPSALAGYAFAVRELIENIDAADAVIGGPVSTNNTFVDYPTTGKLKTPALTGASISLWLFFQHFCSDNTEWSAYALYLYRTQSNRCPCCSCCRSDLSYF